MHALVAPRARSLVGLAVAAVLAIAAGTMAPACGSGGSATGTNSTGGITSCDPGENIFCRCPGGEAGTKTCRDDGMTFDPCVTRIGACPDEMTTTTDASSSSGAGGSGGSTSTGVGGAGTGGGAALGLYAACLQDTECASARCLMGFCTKDCAKFDECTLGTGECVAIAMMQICLPTCSTTATCDGAFGPPSVCGYTKAVDGTPVTTCADWQDALKLPPDGSNCMADAECDLGNAGVEQVCSAQACTTGCHADLDCVPGAKCSSTTMLGTCGTTSYGCPGIPLAVAVGSDTTVMGDPSPATDTTKGSCGGGGGPEIVYAVTPASSGALVVTMIGFGAGNPVLYARTGTCAGGVELGCSDTTAAGGTETLIVPVTAGQPFYLFADAASGTMGNFSLTLHLQAAAPGDTCPGHPVSLSMGTDQTLTGNTNAAGSNYVGKALCTTSTVTKDVVYSVTPTADGTLFVVLDPTYDGQLYARSGSCTTGPQLGCSEAGGAGVAESISFPVVAGMKYSVFADGKGGSAGAYAITFHLGP
ncbi:MAG: hypothetical protein ABJE95_14555 [Byssovorax sp.]